MGIAKGCARRKLMWGRGGYPGTMHSCFDDKEKDQAIFAWSFFLSLLCNRPAKFFDFVWYATEFLKVCTELSGKVFC